MLNVGIIDSFEITKPALKNGVIKLIFGNGSKSD